MLEGPDGLRERFCLQGKYERVNDFKRYVIDVAKKELDMHMIDKKGKVIYTVKRTK